MSRGRATRINGEKKLEWFDMYDRNEVFDDGILKYRSAREENFSLEGKRERIDRVIEALIEILSSDAKLSLETALTCRALSTYLRKNFPNDVEYFRICEKNSLAAILKSLEGLTLADAQLFISDLPNLLHLPYPAVEEIYHAAEEILSQLMYNAKVRADWRNYVELDFLQELLKE